MYEDVLAHIHEQAFAEVARAAAREVRARSRPCRLLDLGCGGGTLAEELAPLGYTVTGIDLSPAMVALARARVPRATFLAGDIGQTALPATDGVTAIGEVFSFACRDVAGLAALLRRLRHADWLLFDVAAPGRDADAGARGGPGWSLRWETRTTEDHLERWFEAARGEDAASERHRLRLFAPRDVDRAARASGWRVEPLGAYDDHALEVGWDAYFARPGALK